MECKLFYNYNFLLIKGSVSMGDEDKIEKVIKELGFSSNDISINNRKPMETKNLYGLRTELLQSDVDEVIYQLKEDLYSLCEKHNIGVFDFFIVEVSYSKMFKSIWHDGFY